MDSLGVNNFISIVIGVSLIVICSLIAYISQKYIFEKYKNKVPNSINEERKSKT